MGQIQNVLRRKINNNFSARSVIKLSHANIYKTIWQILIWDLKPAKKEVVSVPDILDYYYHGLYER